MSDVEYPYVYSDKSDPMHRTLVVNRLPGGTVVGIQNGDQNEGHAYVPDRDPAELHRLVEAILGRKVAAVIYEDELPRVIDDPHADGWKRSSDDRVLQEFEPHVHRSWAAFHLALARHIEARDAAAKEHERAEEEQRAALIEEAKAAIRPLRFNPNTFITDVASLFVDTGWRPSSEEAGR